MKIVLQEVPSDTIRSPLDGTTITIVLDQAVTRMCLKYRLDPVPFMTKMLMEELHNRSVLDDMKHQNCPYCGGKFK